MRHRTTQALYSYWNTVRCDRLAPNRFDIEPSRISDLLPDTMIVENVGAETYHLRLAGTRLCETFGADFRGRDLLTIFNRGDANVLRRNLAVIARQGAVGLFHLQSQKVDGAFCESEMVLLPLVHAERKVDRFLGAWSLDGDAGHDRSLPFLAHGIVDYELVWPRGRPRPDMTQAAPALTPDIRYARVVQGPDRRQFRVYDGGRV